MSLAETHFIAKAARVSGGVFQVVLTIRVLIDADRDYVRRAFALECVGARKHKGRIFALHVVAIEAVRDQPVWTSRHCDLLFERNIRLSF